MAFYSKLSAKHHLIIVNYPLVTNCVIPETILIGNPAFNYLKLWITDTDIRG
jgi:hypothetical protein